MPIVSGRFGAIAGYSSINSWQINDVEDLPKKVLSNTRGGTLRAEGVEDWSGTVNGVGGAPPAMPGAVEAFTGYRGPDSGVHNTVGQSYTGNVIIDQMTLVINWATSPMISWALNFSGDGALAFAGGTTTDVTNPTVLPDKLAAVPQYDDGGVGFTDWDNVEQVTLTISSDNKVYVDASTAGWKRRVAGNIDWTLAVVEHDVSRAKLTKHEQRSFKIFVDAVEFWLLEWGKILDFSNILTNVDTGDILGQTVNIGMDAHDGASIGQIVLPDLTVYWPTP